MHVGASNRMCKKGPDYMEKEAFTACSSCGNGVSDQYAIKKHISFRLERAGFAYINANQLVQVYNIYKNFVGQKHINKQFKRACNPSHHDHVEM